MVSSTLKMDLQELLDTLARIRREHAADSRYQDLRRQLPPDWPM